MTRSILAVVFLFFLGACGNAQEYPHLTTIKGRITVADSVDASRDYSGFNLSIVISDSTGRPDTLYHATTDVEGNFRSQIFVPSHGRYPMTIGRYRAQLATAVIVLGQEDEISLTAEFPDIEKTFLVDSPENEAIRVHDRVTRNYNRVLQFLQAGAVSNDSIPMELQKWSDLYWEMQNSHPKTLAARLGIIESLNILEGWNDSLMVERATSLNADETLKRSTALLSMGAHARLKGLDATVAFLDKRRQESKEVMNRRLLDMAKVTLYTDSLRIDDALSALTAFEKNYSDAVSAGWASVARYDLEHLSLGKAMPAFSLNMEGGAVIPSDSLKGAPYLLEIASLRDPRYQEQFPQMQGYFYVYNPAGLQFITVPVEDNVIVIDAFFEERQQLWPLAEAGTWNQSDLMQRLNVTTLPVRFLVDAQGNIIKKYTGSIETLIHDLRRIMLSQEE